jgi:ketosteroid isomerase-like protein
MSNENVELVRRGLEAFNLGDFDAALEFADPEVEWHDAPDMPDTGTYLGHDAVRKRWEAMHEALDGFYAEPERFFDAGDQVVVFLRVGGTGRGSGIPVDRRVAHVWTIRNGKGTRVDVYTDRDKALEAAGVRDEGPERSSAPTQP